METRDFTNITRNSDKVTTKIIKQDYQVTEEIIVCGDVEFNGLSSDGSTQIRAYLKNGATDFEHDSAQAFNFDLIGVEPKIIGTRNNLYEAWVKPDYDSFRVADIDYNPFDNAEVCDRDYCQLDEHIMTDYLPEQTEKTVELFNQVAGKNIEIRWSVEV